MKIRNTQTRLGFSPFRPSLFKRISICRIVGSLTLQPEDTNSKSSKAEIALDKSRGFVKMRDTEMGGTDIAISIVQPRQRIR